MALGTYTPSYLQRKSSYPKLYGIEYEKSDSLNIANPCSVVELNIAIIVCSLPGMTKFFRTSIDWRPLRSLRSKFSSSRGTTTSLDLGSYRLDKHRVHDAEARRNGASSNADLAQSIDSHSSVDLPLQHPSGLVDDSQASVALQDYWQVDPYLDTSGHGYSWMAAGHLRNPACG